MIQIFILQDPRTTNIGWDLQCSQMICDQNMLSTSLRFRVLGSCFNLWSKCLCVSLGPYLEKSNGVQYLRKTPIA